MDKNRQDCETVQHTLFTVMSHEAGATVTLSRDMVTVSSIPALADLETFLSIET